MANNGISNGNITNDRIIEVSISILSFCMSRTSNQQDAEDLSQDILLELVKSSQNIHDEKAFYGFMWSVAGNVYKQWLAKKARSTQSVSLNGDEGRNDERLDSICEDKSDLYLLRRELALLNERSRNAMILYYLENKSCSEISTQLEISESMVKYLLFKSRKKLKDGMNMERTLGEQSYNPKRLYLYYMFYGDLYARINDNIIMQNILMACYNDSLSAEGISLQIGVPLPYIEKEIDELEKLELLKKKDNKYSTCIMIFTKEYLAEEETITQQTIKETAEYLAKEIPKLEEKVRAIRFYGSNMSHNALMWQIISMLMIGSSMELIKRNQKRISEKNINAAENKVFMKPDARMFVQGLEYSNGKLNTDGSPSSFTFNISEHGDYLQWIKYTALPETMTGEYFLNNKPAINIFMDIAGNRLGEISENDKLFISEMLRSRLVKRKDKLFSVNVPVFTHDQYDYLEQLLESVKDKLYSNIFNLYDGILEKMKNHIPALLKDYAESFTMFRLSPIMYSLIDPLINNNFLKTGEFNGEFPSACIILEKFSREELKKTDQEKTIIVEKNSPAIREDVLIDDIGIETFGGKFTLVLKAGTILPSSYRQIFSTAFDNQPAVTVNIFRGTNEKVDDNVSIGMFTVSGIPPAPAGKPEIEITFSASEGNIYLSAKDKTNKTDLKLTKVS